MEWTKVNYLIRSIGIMFVTLSANYCLAQSDIDRGYSQRLKANFGYSESKIQYFSVNKNAYDFMALGYYINANNIMYLKTQNKEYLNKNMEVIEAVLLADNDYRQDKWRVKVAKSNRNASVNGQQSLLFEGYFFRYVVEFLHISEEKSLLPSSRRNSILKEAKYSFDKWYYRSVRSYRDASRLYHVRLHVGANWAAVALYLHRFTKEKKYKDFYESFDRQLKQALEIKVINGNECYVWFSTYPERFTESLRRAEKEKKIVQDVSHGNHVVNYMIAAYKLDTGAWENGDLARLSNTIKFLLWKPNLSNFMDNVDGTNSKNSSIRNTGWKQSDGWMKLISYDSTLRPIYEKFYQKNQKKVDNSSLALQFYANLKKH